MRPEQNDPSLDVGVVKVKKVANFEALCSNLSLFNKAALIFFALIIRQSRPEQYDVAQNTASTTPT